MTHLGLQGLTHTDEGFRVVQQQLIPHLRPDRDGVHRVLVLITDGAWTSGHDPRAIAARLRLDARVTLVVIGVGTDTERFLATTNGTLTSGSLAFFAEDYGTAWGDAGTAAAIAACPVCDADRLPGCSWLVPAADDGGARQAGCSADVQAQCAGSCCYTLSPTAAPTPPDCSRRDRFPVAVCRDMRMRRLCDTDPVVQANCLLTCSSCSHGPTLSPLYGNFDIILGPFFAHLSPPRHPTRAACYALPGAYADWLLIGAWNPLL